MPTQPFRILIAPLNWGLGHATRCLPIATAFAKTYDNSARSVEIHWASDGEALALLRSELPESTLVHELPSYGVRYPTASASVNMVLGGPQMGAAIVQEARAVADLHKHFNFSFILSDNRFGCRVDGVPSAILTHQIHLPIRNWFSRKLGNMLNHRLLAKFDQVVVPDVASSPRLAGKMSAPHPKTPTHYIGPVSRFSNIDFSGGEGHALAIVISGPEPQRTKLELQLLQALSFTPISGTVVLVRGRPHKAPALSEDLLLAIEKAGNELEVHDYLGSVDLVEVLAKADLIVSRPGYTTVMDLAVLGRKAIYIPTPGQPEQEWLGKSLAARGAGTCERQAELVLAKAITRNQGLNEVKNTSQAQGNTLLKTWVTSVLANAS